MLLIFNKVYNLIPHHFNPAGRYAGKENLYNQTMRFLLLILCLTSVCAAQAAKTHVQIADENAKSVVAVNVMKKDGSTFTGTGFFVSSDGLIATSRHVAEDALYMNITLNTGAVSGEAKPVAQSDAVDLALLKIEGRNLPAVTLGRSEYALPGQIVTVIGNPRRLQNTITSGLLSQIRQKANGTVWHQISAPISPSSSGSPVFDENGEVISVAFAALKGEDNQNLNFAVPSDYLAALMQTAGYPPPYAQTTSDEPQGNAFVRHIQKSWAIVRRLFGKSN